MATQPTQIKQDEPSSLAAKMEEAASPCAAAASSQNTWDAVQASGEASDDAKSPVKVEVKRWQQQAEEAQAEAKQWKAIAGEESVRRVQAEVSLAEWKSRAERAEMMQEKEDNWSKSWQEKLEMQENLCEHWRRIAKDEEACRKKEAIRREEAVAEAAEWKRKFRDEERHRKRWEDEVEKVMRQVKEEGKERNLRKRAVVEIKTTEASQAPSKKRVKAEPEESVPKARAKAPSAKLNARPKTKPSKAKPPKAKPKPTAVQAKRSKAKEVNAETVEVQTKNLKILEDDPNNARAWNNLGQCGGGTVNGTRYNAEECFLEALKLNPGHWAAKNNLQRLHRRRSSGAQ